MTIISFPLCKQLPRWLRREWLSSAILSKKTDRFSRWMQRPALPGQWYDRETESRDAAGNLLLFGLHYNWHRFYDPEVGRYISVDPLGLHGGLNVFGYSFNNPTTYTDPQGLKPDSKKDPIVEGFFEDKNGNPRIYFPFFHPVKAAARLLWRWFFRKAKKKKKKCEKPEDPKGPGPGPKQPRPFNPPATEKGDPVQKKLDKLRKQPLRSAKHGGMCMYKDEVTDKTTGTTLCEYQCYDPEGDEVGDSFWLNLKTIILTSGSSIGVNCPVRIKQLASGLWVGY